MMNNNTMPASDPLEHLLPSLFQCFSVIFMGYLAIRLSIITPQAKALGTYVTKFALPAVFFRCMATINFDDVNWYFILAISLGKFSVFLITVAFTLLITKPINFGMAGILSMFTSQSNDVALGYPILASLYPELAKYVYLFAPTQLIFINPLCLIMLEWNEYREANNNENRMHTSVKKRILLVLKNVLFNPLVYMTAIGVIFNFILSHQLPVIIDKTLVILADSFPGVALFYLGMNMVDKLNSITKSQIYILVFILFGKLIFLPFLIREYVVHLVGLQLSANQTLNYSLVGFLYGGLPTAPPVFLVASDFQILTEVIATGLVIGTFISGPLMFISGRMITMVIASKYQYDNILQSTAVSASTLSIFGCIWVLFVFLFSRRWRSPVHRMTMCYTICVLLSCLGLVIGRIILPKSTDKSETYPGWGNYIQFAIFFIGCTGARLWTCLIALSLAIIKRKSVCHLWKNTKYFYIFGFCVPVLITSFILIFASKQKMNDIDPSFQYGRTQSICSIVVLALSIVATIFFLIIQVRLPVFSQSTTSSISKLIESSVDCQGMLENEENLTQRIGSDSENQSRQILSRYREELEPEQLSLFDSINDEEFQMYRHLTLTVLLVVTMGFGFFLCLWRLINEDVSGIYIELEFLDCVFNFGQGFILWAIFGLDTKLIVIPCRRRFMRFYQSIHEFYIPKEKNLSPEVRCIKNQFSALHLEKCRDEISKTTRQGFKIFRKAFSGRELIDWIVKTELEESRIKAHAYGQALLISRVVEHVKKNENLIDSDNYLYRFVDQNSSSSQEESDVDQDSLSHP